MSHKRIPKRRAAIAAGGVVALGAAAVLLPNANASQDGGSSDRSAAAPRTLKAADASDLAARLAGMLGDTFAGSYYDSGARQLVVNVVPGDDDQVVEQAEKAGAQVREVDHSMGELRSGAETLKSEASIPGTSWAIDPRTNKILVTADRTVTGDRWDRLESTVEGLGSGMATVRKSAGTFKTFASGGDAIFGGGARCSLGFNVTAGDGSPAFLTAGHCGVATDQWSEAQGGQPVATVDQAVFPGEGDFALVTYDDPATEAPSEVNLGDQTLPISGGRRGDGRPGGLPHGQHDRAGRRPGPRPGRHRQLPGGHGHRSHTDRRLRRAGRQRRLPVHPGRPRDRPDLGWQR
ncbi:hypothetical protein RKD37_000910 [Streptomyces ambofaciens]